MRTPHQITITMETSNAAFDDCEHGEIAKQLRHIARRFAEQARNGFDNGAILDTNGNTCGRVTIERVDCNSENFDTGRCVHHANHAGPCTDDNGEAIQ